MPQDLVAKRRNIASRMVTAVEKIVAGIDELQNLKQEFQVAGAFDQTDFDGTDLRHLTPAIVGQLIGGGASTTAGALLDVATVNPHKTALLGALR